MDFDNDGIRDLISGSYDPGEFYLFRGLGHGEFMARETIVDRSGRSVLRYPDQKVAYQSFGSWIAMTDWENDGDLDLILGGFQGELMVRLNEGTRAKPVFATENFNIQINGQDAKVPGSHATPVVADWDNDGRWDLLSGSATGAVYWYRNVGHAEAPKFDEPQELVPPHKGSGYGELLDIGEESRLGIRSQIFVTDYNLDGKLDLLVGDFCTTVTPRADLTSIERADMLSLRDQIEEANSTLRDMLQRLRESFSERYSLEELTEEAEKEWQHDYEKMRISRDYKEALSASERHTEAFGTYLEEPATKSRFGDKSTCHGYVWLFLRK